MRHAKWLLAAVTVLSMTGNSARAGHGFFAVGVNLGFPVYYRPYYPCYQPYPVYYRPYPVYVAPAPVVVESPTTVVQPLPVAQTAPPPAQTAYTPPPPATLVARSQAPDVAPSEVERHLQLLADANDQTRIDSVMYLGRHRATQAIDPLAATLAGDRSPAVREAAARALGLIGAPKALTSLQQAAQVDNDREVRHSAQFAMEIIQTRN